MGICKSLDPLTRVPRRVCEMHVLAVPNTDYVAARFLITLSSRDCKRKQILWYAVRSTVYRSVMNVANAFPQRPAPLELEAFFSDYYGFQKRGRLSTERR